MRVFRVGLKALLYVLRSVYRKALIVASELMPPLCSGCPLGFRVETARKEEAAFVATAGALGEEEARADAAPEVDRGGAAHGEEDKHWGERDCGPAAHEPDMAHTGHHLEGIIRNEARTPKGVFSCFHDYVCLCARATGWVASDVATWCALGHRANIWKYVESGVKVYRGGKGRHEKADGNLPLRVQAIDSAGHGAAVLSPVGQVRTKNEAPAVDHHYLCVRPIREDR